jgi:site-specific DNA-methyltransferase (adenine-specific)
MKQFWWVSNEKLEDWAPKYAAGDFGETGFHAVLSDLPYGLEFMGQEWDGRGAAKTMREVYRAWGEKLRTVLYPGAVVLMFGGTRTWHHLATGMEDAGFELWDTIMWLHGQGFPKAQDIGDLKQDEAWRGYKTLALKPAWEPVLCFQAPDLGKRHADLAREFGTATLNIDGARIAIDELNRGNGVWGSSNAACRPTFIASPGLDEYRSEQHPLGRYPANVVIDGEVAEILDRQSGELTSGANPERRNGDKTDGIYGRFEGRECNPARGADSGGASRFFYCAKASREEREFGCDALPLQEAGIKNDAGRGFSETDPYAKIMRRNVHPTVKPIALCRWLAKLLLPPDVVKERRLLVPMCGAGSEMIGALKAGWDVIHGVEQKLEYCQIATARLVYWEAHPDFEDVQMRLL